MIDPLDGDFPFPHQDPPEIGDVRWVDPDRAFVKLKREGELHWAEKEKLGYRMEPREPVELGDQLADHSDDQGWDIEDVNESEEA